MNNGLFYFLAGGGGLTAWAALGRGYAFAPRDPHLTTAGALDGPDRKAGTIFHRCDISPLPGPIEWHRCADESPELYIGFVRSMRPGPDDLYNGARLHAAAGERVRLCDGNYWSIPIVTPCRDRGPERACGLPHSFVSGRDDSLGGGRVVELEVKPEYAPLRARCERLLEPLEAEREQRIESAEMFGLCADLLAVCYRVSVDEVLALGLLDPDNAWHIVLVALDMVERIKCNALVADEAKVLDDADVHAGHLVVARGNGSR